MRAIQTWLNRFCVRHPRFSIPGLMRYIVFGNVLVYLLDMFSRYGASQLLSFSPYLILQGQIWRLLTFVFVPTATGGLILFAISLYFYYFIGTALEQEWGSVKFTVFYSLGILFNILVGFLVGTASMDYVNMSLFFAFATLYPNLQFLLFFIIPIKAKWLAWFDAAFFVFTILMLLFKGMFLMALLPVIAILNYLLFFGADFLDSFQYWKKRTAHKHNRNTVDFHSAQKHAKQKKGYLHKCAVCGRTDVTNPELEFRYCSRCNGYYCYCSDHINSHVHIE